jgi:hypothetical protein
VTATIFEFQPKTRRICFPPSPAPPAVNDPETVNDDPACNELGDADAVNDVETGLESDPVFKFKVIEPGPVAVTSVTSFDPEQAKPPLQIQPAGE